MRSRFLTDKSRMQTHTRTHTNNNNNRVPLTATVGGSESCRAPALCCEKFGEACVRGGVLQRSIEQESAFVAKSGQKGRAVSGG